jgi:hypothetical protein
VPPPDPDRRRARDGDRGGGGDAVTLVLPPGDPQSGSAKALSVIDDYTKLLIVLATGVVVLSATFLSNFYRGYDLWSIVLSWVFCGVSVLVGLMARGAYISQLTAGRLRPRRDTLEFLNMVQWISLIVGVGFLGYGVIANVNASPTVFQFATRAPMAAGASNIPLACHTGDGSGCRLQVRVSTLTVPIAYGATSLAEVPSDSATSVHVHLPPALARAVRRHGAATGSVTIAANGRIGSTSTTVLDMTFVRSPSAADRRARAARRRSRRRAPPAGATGTTG